MKNTFSSISKAALLTGLMITFLAVSACEDNRMTPDPGIVMDTGNGGHEDDTWVCEPDCSGKVCGADDGCDGTCLSGLCPGDQVCQNGVCFDGACVPDCDGKVCGANDGCGGFCDDGLCSGYDFCQNAICLEAPCQPNCSGKVCGANDGCGGFCLDGLCPGNDFCQNGVCLEAPCQPNCIGKVCGADDGCGGTCLSGLCPNDQSCQNGVCLDGPCVPACGNNNCGPDGCGGVCGVCGANQSCNNGTCVDDNVPSENCTNHSDDDGDNLHDCDDPDCFNHPACEEQCDPDCLNKHCGDDGCGGTCGTCGANQTCNGSICVDDPVDLTEQVVGFQMTGKLVWDGQGVNVTDWWGATFYTDQDADPDGIVRIFMEATSVPAPPLYGGVYSEHTFKVVDNWTEVYPPGCSDGFTSKDHFIDYDADPTPPQWPKQFWIILFCPLQ